MGILDILKENAPTCPCCSKWQEYEGFQQLIELKNSGVIIYLHRSTEVATRSEEVANTTSEDVYILHNVKNNNILTADVLAQLDKNKIYCPRCRKTYEHAQKLFQQTSGCDKRDVRVIAICDHCRIKARPQKPCDKCDEVIRKFLKAYNAQRQSPTKDIKTWLAKIGDIINKTKQKVKSMKSVRRSKSETDFDQLSYQGLSKYVRDLKTEPMFHSKTTLSDTDITRTRKYSKNQKGDSTEELLEPIYVFPKHISTSNKTHLLHDLEINKPGHLRKHDRFQTLSTDPVTKAIVKERDKKQETTSEHIFKEGSKASKKMFVTKQNDISTAARDEDKHTKLILTDDLSKKKRNLNVTQETDKHSEKKHYVSAPTDKLLLVKNKSKIESQETQKTKPAIQSKKIYYDVTAGSEDSFKDKQYQATNKFNRLQEKDDLVLKKQKQKKFAKETQSKNIENNLKEKETYSKRENIDIYRDKKQLKSNKSEMSPLRETTKPLIEEAKASKEKTKEKTQTDAKRGRDKEKTQIKEIETKNRADVPKNVLEKEKHDNVDVKEFKKLQEEHAKNKDREIKKQKQADLELQKVKDTVNKKVKEDTKNKLDSGQMDTKVKEKDKDEDKVQSKELNVITGATVDSQLLKLMQKDKQENADLKALKKLQEEQTKNKEKELKQQKQAEVELEKMKEAANKKDKEFNKLLPLGHFHRTSSAGTIYSEEDVNMATEIYMKELQRNPREIIIGEHITKYKQTPYLPAEKQDTALLMNMYSDASSLQPHRIADEIKKESEAKTDKITANIKMEPKDKVDPESTKGIIRYSLSDRTFIDKGWTMLPTEKVVRKMNVYRMRPAHPEFDWFEHNKNKRLMQYDTGEKLADFNDKGRGRWYYKSGQIALDYYDAEETNAQQRFVVYSSGEPDERGRSYPVTILATFDYLGNGIVFDHGGKIRLKYNQTEGVVLDRSIGPVSHWKWHTLNDPPVLQQVMIDTQMALKDPDILKMRGPHDKKPRPDNEEMLAIEFDNFIKEKSKKLSQKFMPFQIKMKALKINEHFSLRVLDQATIYLIFRDGSTNVKLNIGMVLDHQEIVDTDTAEVGEVSNNLERFPARTDSLAELQRSVAYAQRYERAQTERERRLRPSKPCVSADMLTSAISRPLKPAMRTVPTASTCSTGSTKNNRRLGNNLYYNSRIL